MTDARTETPNNLNYLQPLVFKFQIKKTPNLNFFVQNINLPGLTLPNTVQPNPFVNIPIAGDHIIYDDLMINYKVNEDLSNYLEILNWITGLGFPNNFNEYKVLEDKPPMSGEGLTSDISLIIMSSSRNPTFDITFKDAFPISISSLIFDTTQADIQYLEAAATFRYRSYEITPYNT